jgi:hypothetical protein
MPSQITCIKKPPPHNSHEAIMRVGGVRADGERFNIPLQECAEDILNGVDLYRVQVQDVQVNVVAYEIHGGLYIKTTSGKDQPDNLLNLDQC